MTSTVLAPLAIVIATALLMEAVAMLLHRYVMHGPGWGWHRSHHEPHEGRLERNDLYAVVPATLAIVLMWIGDGALRPLYWVGAGMTLYGTLYFILHDGLVHRRWPLRWQPRRGYIARLVQAHRLHHAVQQRQGCVSFGFLYAPPAAQLAAQLKRQRQHRSPAAAEDALGRREASPG